MDKRKMTAIVGVLSVMTLGVLAGCGPKAEDTDTTTAPSNMASPGAMTASPGAMSASPGAMTAPPGPK